jgi:hypothetical protein
VIAADQAAYEYTATRSKAAKSPDHDRAPGDRDQAASTAAWIAIAAGVQFSRELGNLPPNICNPAYLAEQCDKLATEFDRVTCEVLERAEMEKLGMGALLAVGRGSANPPRLVVLRYTGAGDAKPFALVGKGITFDTGGINLKTQGGIEEMKFDMCGAATVIGTFFAAATMKLPAQLVTVVAAVENMPDGNAYRPSDVLTSMSGKTIEVGNTDAEGRLVLCDALTYYAAFRAAGDRRRGHADRRLRDRARQIRARPDEQARRPRRRIIECRRKCFRSRLAPAAVGRIPADDRLRVRRHLQHRRQGRRRDHCRLLPVALHRRPALGASGHRRHQLGRRPQGPGQRSPVGLLSQWLLDRCADRALTADGPRRLLPDRQAALPGEAAAAGLRTRAQGQRQRPAVC